MCMIKAPNGTGDALREREWNLDKYPGITDTDRENLVPMWNAYEDLYFMDWEDVLDRFETLHVTLNYHAHTWSERLNVSSAAFVQFRITDDQEDKPFVVNSEFLYN